MWGKELYFDSTKVKANADVESLRSRSIAQNHLKELFFEETGSQQIEDFATPHLSPEASAVDALPMAGEESLMENNARNEDWISRDGRQERAFSSGPRKRTADRLVSTTDPDATPMRLSEGETKLGYQAHYVVDGGKARVILNVLVTPSEVSENRPMLDLLWRSCFRWRLWPHHVTGGAKYGTAENVKAIESAHTSGRMWHCMRAGVRARLSSAKASSSMIRRGTSTCARRAKNCIGPVRAVRA